MTFQDAMNFKLKLGTDRVTQDDLPLRVCITPADREDFTRYITEYRLGHIPDEASKKYSLNGQFKVCGIWTDGVNVSYTVLFD